MAEIMKAFAFLRFFIYTKPWRHEPKRIFSLMEFVREVYSHMAGRSAVFVKNCFKKCYKL